MEFWGVEVKAGKPLKVVPENGKLIHISQAALGEGKRDKGANIVPIRLNIDDKKIVLGSLSADNFPQIAFDLVFEKEFELSHDWKNGSVYFCGYIAANLYEEEDDHEFDSDSEDEENVLLPTTQNGKVEPQDGEVKPAAAKAKAAKPESTAKSKATVVEPKKDESDSDDDDVSDDDVSDDDVSDDDVSDDEEMVDADAEVKEMKKIYGGSSDSDDSEDDIDEISDSDEETPDKPADKKRPNESASKTPVAKKSKIDSSKKTDGKKGGHVATPHPSKKTEKSPAPIKQSPKSDAKISCNSCPKKFTSDGALQSHTKAKHAAK